MRRFLVFCSALALSVFGFTILGQESPNSPTSLRGTYAFTLNEKCTHQLGVNTPGFDSNLHLIDPMGAETYSGASNGLMVFDGFGGVTIQQGLATNLMNATNPIAANYHPDPVRIRPWSGAPFHMHGHL